MLFLFCSRHCWSQEIDFFDRGCGRRPDAPPPVPGDCRRIDPPGDRWRQPGACQHLRRDHRSGPGTASLSFRAHREDPLLAGDTLRCAAHGLPWASRRFSSQVTTRGHSRRTDQSSDRACMRSKSPGDFDAHHTVPRPRPPLPRPCLAEHGAASPLPRLVEHWRMAGCRGQGPSNTGAWPGAVPI